MKIQFARENILSSYVVDGDMMVVKCGKYIKYGTISDAKWNGDKGKSIDFEIVRIHLDDEVMIEKIWST